MARYLAWTSIAAVCLAQATLARAAPEGDCRGEWQAADRNADGVLEGAEAARYLAYLRLRHDPLPADGRLTQGAFLRACRNDLFTAAAPGLPKEGAASLSADEAKARATAAGYSAISSLVRNGEGLWRASAMKDGKATRIVVDKEGNVAPADD